MNRLKLTNARQKRFLKVLADTGNVTAAVAVTGTSRTRVYELRRTDPVFAAAWEEAGETAVDKLEAEARRRAVEGVPEPLVSAGRLVCGADGEPIAIRRYNLLLALLRAHRPRRARSVRFRLPMLQSASDAAGAMAAITAGVAAGDMTAGEASDFAKLVEAYVKALEAGQFDHRLRAIERRNDAKRS
jgi:hypothetical protein